MLTKTLLIAGAASALMAGSAMAQSPTHVPADQIQDNPHSSLTVNPVPGDHTTVSARPADQAITGAQTDTSTIAGSRDDGDADTSTRGAASVPMAGSLTIETVTNGPVPDTRENRAKYGMPMSNAGKSTAARGN
ncbi:MAG: hypothetical protein EON94_10095 [Caulobacteraceae bacterium]|nr:MAG: hypothetical protein EON94_10095 [Caulobacteraceae bacterium]